MELLTTISRRDPCRLCFAPVIGLAAGFIVNRARSGAMGVELLLEMLLFATILTLVVAAGSAIAAIEREKARARQEHLAALDAAERRALARARQAGVEAEARHCRNEIALRDAFCDMRNRLIALEGLSNSTDLRNQLLKRAIIELNGRVSDSPANLGAALKATATRIDALEARQQEMLDAREKLVALEAAQEEISRHAVALSEQARRDAEEVKASLKLAISDSQRQRNLQAPEREESGRIIELEARLKRLAREIERLSSRGDSVAEEGIASNVAPGGTQDQAKLGFFKALLDANVALRKQTRTAA
jgi:hypothetical protein